MRDVPRFPQCPDTVSAAPRLAWRAATLAACLAVLVGCDRDDAVVEEAPPPETAAPSSKQPQGVVNVGGEEEAPPETAAPSSKQPQGVVNIGGRAFLTAPIESLLRGEFDFVTEPLDVLGDGFWIQWRVVLSEGQVRWLGRIKNPGEKWTDWEEWPSPSRAAVRDLGIRANCITGQGPDPVDSGSMWSALCEQQGRTRLTLIPDAHTRSLGIRESYDVQGAPGQLLHVNVILPDHGGTLVNWHSLVALGPDGRPVQAEPPTESRPAASDPRPPVRRPAPAAPLNSPPQSAQQQKVTAATAGPDAVAPGKAPQSDPSFDCFRASTLVERLICNSPKLARLDREMAERYLRLRQEATDRQALKDEQAAWRRNERDRCQDSTCIHAAYAARLKQLRELEESAAAAQDDDASASAFTLQSLDGEVPRPPADRFDNRGEAMCEGEGRRPESDTDKALAGAGWILFYAPQSLGETTLATAAASLDGQCRSRTLTAIVFRAERAVAAIAPSDPDVHPEYRLADGATVIASAKTYSDGDARCCPSGSATVAVSLGPPLRIQP